MGRPYSGRPIVAVLKRKNAEDRDGLDDEELVGRILAGDEDLFEVLVRRYQSRVLAHVGRMVGNRDDALDLSQEIFLKVFGALNRYNPAFKFSTWLFRIAGNAAIDHLRKRRPRTVPLEVHDADGGMSALPLEFRELITLRHFGGLSYEEIAEVKQMPLGTVKNKLFRARAVLKERL